MGMGDGLFGRQAGITKWFPRLEVIQGGSVADIHIWKPEEFMLHPMFDFSKDVPPFNIQRPYPLTAIFRNDPPLFPKEPTVSKNKPFHILKNTPAAVWGTLAALALMVLLAAIQPASAAPIGGGTGFTQRGVSSAFINQAALGPAVASSTDNAVVRWDGTTGRLLQDSIFTVGDTGIGAGLTALGINGATPGSDAVGVTGSMSISGAIFGSSNVRAGVNSSFQFGTNRSAISAPADGNIRLTNNAFTDFSCLQLGGTSTAFGAICRNGAGVSARLADASADASFTAANLNVTGSTAPPIGIYMGAANALYFSTNTTARWLINSAGKLGTNASTGGALIAGTATSTVPGYQINQSDTTSGVGGVAGVPAMIVGSTSIMSWSSTGPNIAVIPTDSGATDATLCRVTATGAVVTGSGTLGICLGTSSARYKRGIEPMQAGLAQILALKPKNFFYRKGHGDGGAKLQYGFIAEDVVNVVPDLVGLDEKKRPNSVDLVGMIPILVKANQELTARVARLEAQMRIEKAH